MTSERRGNPLQNLPLPALFLTVAGLWVAVQLSFHSGRIDLITVLITVLGGLVFSGITTALAAANRRRLGGTGQASAFTRALRTGIAPAGADTSRWGSELDRLDSTRTRRTVLPVALSILPIGLGVWGLTDPDARPIAVLLILLFAALDVIAVLYLPVQRRRAARLRNQLEPDHA